MSERFHESMQTFVRDIYYAFEERKGTLCLPEGYCADMSGTIEFFKRLDPEVQKIFVYVDPDAQLDMLYQIENGVWVPYQAKKK